MTLSLADIERWDPASIRAVFEAAIHRARGTRTASAAVTETVRLLDFGGDTAEAAHAAIHHTTLILETHADACEAVGQAAEKSAEEVVAIRWRLQAIRQTARDHHLTIDDATDTVLPPPNLPSYSLSDQHSILETQFEVVQRISQLLHDAESADEDLAAAIRGADGELSPERVKVQINHEPPKMPKLPPAGTPPEEVNTWWHALTPSQQARVKEWFGNSIRNLDGIPISIRNKLNLTVLQREISRLRNCWYDENGVLHTDLDKLTDLQTLQTTLHDHPDLILLLLDTTSSSRTVLAAIAKGDVENAERVGVTVGGINTSVRASVDGMAREAIAQYNQTVHLRNIGNIAHPDSVATIAWLGYESPGANLNATSDAMAHTGATSLNRFYHGLAATTNNPDQQIVAFGHSYGSLTTSLALQQGAPVHDVVLYGSPGAEVTNASQLGVAPEHAFFERGVNDIVPRILAESHIFGPPIQDIPGFIELSANSGSGVDGLWHERAYGHSEYTSNGDNGLLRMSGYNLAAVLAGVADPGNPDALRFIVTPLHLPSSITIFGVRPFGLPVPNPEYHP